MLFGTSKYNRTYGLRRLMTWVQSILIFTVFFTSSTAMASLDLAELYFRKIEQGERTFFQNGGWQTRHTRAEFFYEGNYILNAGTGDPRFIQPLVGDEDFSNPMGTYSLGGILLLTPKSSKFELIWFVLMSKSFEVDAGSDVLSYFPLIAPIVPGALALPDGRSTSQSIYGFRTRYDQWMELTYGLLLDERRGIPTYSSFLETNIPFLFLRSNFILQPGGEVDRLNFVLEYDKVDWFESVELGLLHQSVNDSRWFVYAGVDGLFNFIKLDVRFTSAMEFAYVQGGVHWSSFKPGDPRRKGKFGTAWDLKLLGCAIDPSKANSWSESYGTPEIQGGVLFEAYVQMPLAKWGGIFYMLLAVQAAAYEEDDQKRDKMIEDAVHVAADFIDSAEEDDAVYGGLTFGARLNDAETLREIPGAAGHWHIYFNYRIIY